MMTGGDGAEMPAFALNWHILDFFFKIPFCKNKNVLQTDVKSTRFVPFVPNLPKLRSDTDIPAQEPPV